MKFTTSQWRGVNSPTPFCRAISSASRVFHCPTFGEKTLVVDVNGHVCDQ